MCGARAGCATCAGPGHDRASSGGCGTDGRTRGSRCGDQDRGEHRERALGVCRQRQQVRRVRDRPGERDRQAAGAAGGDHEHPVQRVVRRGRVRAHRWGGFVDHDHADAVAVAVVCAAVLRQRPVADGEDGFRHHDVGRVEGQGRGRGHRLDGRHVDDGEPGEVWLQGDQALRRVGAGHAGPGGGTVGRVHQRHSGAAVLHQGQAADEGGAADQDEREVQRDVRQGFAADDAVQRPDHGAEAGRHPPGFAREVVRRQTRCRHLDHRCAGHPEG